MNSTHQTVMRSCYKPGKILLIKCSVGTNVARRGMHFNKKRSFASEARSASLLLVRSHYLQRFSRALDTYYITRFIGGFHVTSSPPCWWTVNKRSLISSFCLSTSICSFHHCYLCLPRLHENLLSRLIKWRFARFYSIKTKAMRDINRNSVKFNNNSQITPLRPVDVSVVASPPSSNVRVNQVPGAG